MQDENQRKQYDSWKVAQPVHEEHGIKDTFENPLSDRLVGGNPRNWRLEGNQLHCETDFGPMGQTIPTNYILMGTDEKGLPIFKKVA